MKRLEEVLGGEAAVQRNLPSERIHKSLAHHGGFAFFWVLNDQCDHQDLLRQLEAFQQAGVEAVVLHPRGGLLVPYGSSDWFELIHWLVKQCIAHQIEPILYDEDPYPSGNAGGQLIADHPEFAGAAIKRFVAEPLPNEGELFIFPQGRLCWAGVIFPDAPEKSSIDLTAKVGMIRRQWEKAEWDSRWYYPTTPLYSCPRAFALHAEFAIRVPHIPEGGKLVAFVACRIERGNEWGGLVDTLNPEATAHYLRLTHEQYAQSLDKLLGREVKFMFTDEAKPHATYAWTPALFTSFEENYGYDLRVQLDHLFEVNDSAVGMRVRLDYRNWIQHRFLEAWLQPVSDWVRHRNMQLIGHFSPEEDPVSQSSSIGNFFPLQKHLAFAGYDIIIPAVGDDENSILNVAAVAACSAAQQNKQPGICCESLGVFGWNVSPQTVAKSLVWQVLHGVNLAVVHGSFSSDLGLRRYEAPPDYGPHSNIWEQMTKIRQDLKPLFESTFDATQEAPIAILWPILSFQARGETWDIKDQCGLRRDFLDLLQDGLDHQMGMHIIDENGLQAAEIKDCKLLLGKAAYQWILIPSLTVLNKETLDKLKMLVDAGIQVIGVGDAPSWAYSKGAALTALESMDWPQFRSSEFSGQVAPLLPRLVEFEGVDLKGLHVSIWNKASSRELLAMNLGAQVKTVKFHDQVFIFSPGELIRFKAHQGRWVENTRFSPNSYLDHSDPKPLVDYGEWEMTLPNAEVRRSTFPLATYQLLPIRGEVTVHSILTRGMWDGCRQEGTISYRVKVAIPKFARKVTLWVEPTLMRGSFTLQVNEKQWDFVVADTDTEAQPIDLSDGVKDGQVILTFVLHQPDGLDGIKHHPLISLD